MPCVELLKQEIKFRHLRHRSCSTPPAADRLARSCRDLHDIIAQLSAMRVGFRCVQLGAVDTTTSMGKLILGILGAVAEFETDIRKERQREGIERAKAAGIYKGRKPTVDAAQLRSLRDKGLGATDIATKLGIARASVYRALKSDQISAT
nr:recombinase family protein [Tsuneonella mangrovi]